MIFKVLAKVNKVIFPSYSKQRLSFAEANKLQKAIIGWRYYVTKRAINQ